VSEAAIGRTWVVSGRNGENRLHAEGRAQAEAWHNACLQAAAVGMLGGPRRSDPWMMPTASVYSTRRGGRKRSGAYSEYATPNRLPTLFRPLSTRRGCARPVPGRSSAGSILTGTVTTSITSLNAAGPLTWWAATPEDCTLASAASWRIILQETWRILHRAFHPASRTLPGGPRP
jgi:hypothetical protein